MVAQLSDKHGLTTWRQYQYNVKTVKQSYRNAQQSKNAKTKDEPKKLTKIQEAHQEYIDLATSFLVKVSQTMNYLGQNKSLSVADVLNLVTIDEYINHGKRQIDQIRRRVLFGEVIPNEEKVFSLFEPHTEWICKGKLGVPVELGVRVCIAEDKNQFILHHKVMWKKTDEKLTVPMAKEVKQQYPCLHSISYDRGFYSKSNREELSKVLVSFALPKKGKLSESDKTIQSSEDYIEAKKKHSAVESAINALDVHGLDRCLDHGKHGFERYIALAVVGRNVQLIGAILLKKELRLLLLRERRQKLKAA